MSRSAFVEVNITNPTRLAQDSQDTANKAVKGVENLNDPNLMNVIEKQNNVVQFAGLTSQYNVLVQNAKDDGIDTTAVTTAYNNLNRFMADILADPDHASDVDRATYKKYQDAYNEELANIQSALQNNTNNKFASAASATSQAASTANIAKSAADSAYDYANSEMAVQSNATAKAQSTADNAFNQAQAVGSQVSAEISNNSTATAKAQSTADNAFSQATTAIDNGKVTSQAVTDLKDGSKLTIADLENGLATKVANSDYASYKEQTASQIGQMVTNGAFSAYQQTTANLIAQKVATSDFSSYQATTAKAIESKVESKDFNTYKQQTATAIDDKVSSSEYASDKIQTASEIADRVSNSAFSTYQTQTASQIAQKVDNGAFSAYQQTTANLISSKVATSDFSSYKDQTATAIGSKVESKDFNSYKEQTDKAIISKVESKDFQALQTQVGNSAVGTNLLLGTATSVSITGNNSSNQGKNTYSLAGGMSAYTLYQKYGSTFTLSYDWSVTDTASAYAGSMQQQFNQAPWGFGDATTISSSNKSGHKVTTFTLANSPNNIANGLQFRIDNVPTTSTITVSNMKLEKGSVATDYSVNPEDQATQSQFTQLSDQIDLRVKKDDLISDINAQAGHILISASHQLTLSSDTIYFDSKNPVIIPSANIDTALVKKTLTAADISANTFTTNNGTFTVDKAGLVTATSLIIRGSTNLVYNSSLAGANGSYIPGWGISNNGTCWAGNLHDGVPSIGYNASTGAGVWTNFAQTKLHPLNGDTYQPFSASVWFKEYGSDTGLLWQFTLAFFDSNGNRTDGYVGNTWNGIGSDQDWRYVTIDNVTPPKNAVSVGLQYWSYNGHGNACFSSPMLTQTAKATGYQPDTGNVVSAGTVIGTNIIGSNINGTTFNAGSVDTNANNTAKFYPFTADSNGVLRSYHVDNYFANSARIYSGNIIISDRNMSTTDGNKYGGETAVLGGSSLTLSSGYTVGKDTDFTKPLVAEGEPGTTQLILSGINGITLKGDDQKIHFHGMYSDSQPKGITFTPYGNINGDEGSTTGNWYVGYNLANMTAQFGIDNLTKNTINFYRPLFVDEIGALDDRLSNGRLLLHAVDGNAQMYLLNDSSPALVSPTVYNRTYSNGANVYVTSAGRIGRTTSASKYKLAITRSDDTVQADRLMTLKPASWNDKVATEKMAESLSNGEIPVEEEINLKRHYGLIAEDLRDAGLDEFLITGNDGQIEGIEYDRLWTVLIPKIKQLNNRINELERKTL